MFAFPNNFIHPHFPVNMSFANNPVFIPPSKLASISHQQLSNLSKCFGEIKTPNFTKATLTINSLLSQLDEQIKKPTDLLHKRSLQHFDSHASDIECIHKKVKLDDGKSNLSTEDDNLSKKDFHELCSPQNGTPNGFKVIEEEQKSGKGLKPVLCKKGESSLKKNLVENVSFSPEQNNLIFKVAFNVDSQNKAYKTLTREELLKEDPLLLLSFYENHLQFVKTPDFQPSLLKKI